MTDGERASPAPAPTGLRLGSVLGFEIRVDLSWLVIFFLVFWSLAEAVFPQALPEQPRSTYLVMGLAGTLLFFSSLLAHELSHALVSRAKGIPVEGITLFIFGGIARMRREPDSPRDELLIAGVGPLASFLIAGLFALLGRLAGSLDLGAPVIEVAEYLALINLVLAIFNLMPGFPLDGGRVFRAIAWGVTGDRMKATRWAVLGGRSFGLLLIVLGALQALTVSPLSGLWLVFIGWFLRTLAGSTLQQQVLQDLLRGYVTADLMSPRPEVVPAGISVAELVQRHFMRLRYGSYPVLDGGELVGMVTLEDVKRVPQEAWAGTSAADAMTPIGHCAVVSPSTSLQEALQEMSRPSARGRALVVEAGRLVGIVSASDISRWIQRVQAVESLVGRQM
jgi:Zn-dependent protease/predicted transcriptional regulator